MTIKRILSTILLAAALLASGCPSPPANDAPDKNSGEDKDSPKKERRSLLPPKPMKSVTGPDTHKDLTAPEKFAVKLDTTKGDIIIDVERAWSPTGADRFYTLVKEGFYSDVAFFRVLPGFMAQTGLSGDPVLNAQWRKRTIEDDPVVKQNKRGTVSYAKPNKKDSRTTQFFINFDENLRLDKMGFAPFGKVRDMTAVDKINTEYGQKPSQQFIQSQGNEYLKAKFPNLDYIINATLVIE